MARIVIVLFVATFLASCEATVRGPSAEISTPKLNLYDGSISYFCPPGQAKKGRC
jgi:hypothetical protein